MFVVKKRMAVSVQLQILYFVVIKTNDNMDATLDFLICRQKTNDRIQRTNGTILNFAVKNIGVFL